MVLTMKILLALITIVFLMLLIILSSPLTYDLSLHGAQGKIQFHMVCRNFFWAMSIQRGENRTNREQRFLNQSLSKSARSHSAASERSAPSVPLQIKSTTSLLLQVIHHPALLKRGLKFVKQVWQKVKPRHLTVNACVGCSEPHQTGWIMAAAAILQADNDCYTINLTGNWLESCLDGEIHLAGKFIPAAVLWPAFKFLASSEVRPYYRLYRKQNNAAPPQTT